MGFGKSVKNFLADAEGFSLRPTWKKAVNAVVFGTKFAPEKPANPGKMGGVAL